MLLLQSSRPARVALLCLLTSALCGVWCIEQPSGSILFSFPALQHVCAKLKALDFSCWEYVLTCLTIFVFSSLPPCPNLRRCSGEGFGCGITWPEPAGLPLCGPHLRGFDLSGEGSFAVPKCWQRKPSGTLQTRLLLRDPTKMPSSVYVSKAPKHLRKQGQLLS